jgi:hypothetical protein
VGQGAGLLLERMDLHIRCEGRASGGVEVGQGAGLPLECDPLYARSERFRGNGLHRPRSINIRTEKKVQKFKKRKKCHAQTRMVAQSYQCKTKFVWSGVQIRPPLH